MENTKLKLPKVSFSVSSALWFLYFEYFVTFLG